MVFEADIWSSFKSIIAFLRSDQLTPDGIMGSQRTYALMHLTWVPHMPLLPPYYATTIAATLESVILAIVIRHGVIFVYGEGFHIRQEPLL